jgi:hypothetical protein
MISTILYAFADTLGTGITKYDKDIKCNVDFPKN